MRLPYLFIGRACFNLRRMQSVKGRGRCLRERLAVAWRLRGEPIVSYPLIYLRDVLGIRGLPLVSAESKQMPLPKSGLVVWVDDQPSLAQKEMAEKMLAAIDCHNVQWQIGSLEASANYFVVRFGEPGENSTRFLNLPELSHFLGSDASVRELKKETWVQLKKFKAAMDL